jgi:hypothetical protein
MYNIIAIIGLLLLPIVGFGVGFFMLLDDKVENKLAEAKEIGSVQEPIFQNSSG